MKRTGNSFALLANTPAIANTQQNLAFFSPDDAYLAVGGGNPTIKLAVYKRSGDTFTTGPTFNVQPYSQLYSIAWSPDGTYLACGITSGTKLEIYKRSGDTFTQIPVPNATSYSATGKSVSWSPDGNYVSIALDNNPWLVVYERSGDVFTKLTTPTGLPTTGQTTSTSYSGLTNSAPTAPTLVAPADLSEVPSADPLLYDWVFNDPDFGDGQSEFALVRRGVAR